MESNSAPGPAKVLILVLLGIITSAAFGAISALLTATHSWGILAPVVLLSIAYPIYRGTKFFLRAAHISNIQVGLLMALLMMAAYILTETLVASSFMNTDLPGFYNSRWNTGLALFGSGSWTLSGWLWAIPYAVKVFFVFILYFGAAADEGDRPYCESCASATTNLIWKHVAYPFDQRELNAFPKTHHQWDLPGLISDIHQTPDGNHGILVKLWTCNCNTCYEFRAESYNMDTNIAFKELIGFLPLREPDISVVVDWALKLNPQSTIPDPVQRIRIEHSPAVLLDPSGYEPER